MVGSFHALMLRHTPPSLRLRPACLLGLLALAGPLGAQKAVRGLGEDDPAGATPARADAVLLIDGVEVPADAYASWLIEEVGPPLVAQFAGGWAVEREAARRGLEVGSEEIQAALEDEIAVRVQGAFLGRREDWIAELRRLGRSERGHRRQRETELGTLLATTKLAADGRVVPEEKVVRDWERDFGPQGRAFELEMMQLRVLVHTPGDELSHETLERAREEARSEGLRRARAARARRQAGEDFASLARELSDDEATRASGGHVARFVQFRWPTGFVDALFELGKGELSEPLFARGGWWLVRVIGWKDTPLESVRPALVGRLIELGPEQDEIGAAWNAVTKDLDLRVLPELYSPIQSVEAGTQQADGLLIDGEPVARSVYARWLLYSRGEASWQQFTEDWLVDRQAQEKGIQVDAAEIDARVREQVETTITEGYHGDRSAWLSYLALTGRDEESHLRQLARRARLVRLAEKLILSERQITAGLVEQRYRELYGSTGRRVQARMILLEIETPDLHSGLSREELQQLFDQAAEERRLDAQALAGQLAGGEDFATLAQRHSDERISAELGGRLEGGFRPSAWPAAVRDAVMALGRGEVSPPLLAGRAWTLFEVDDFEQVPFEGVAAEIRQELERERPGPADLAAFRNVLLQASEVELLPALVR